MNILRVDVRFQADSPDPDLFDTFLETVADRFFEAHHQELDYGGSLTALRTSFAITLPEATVTAMERALRALGEAIEAAGGRTPGWPSGHSIVASSFEECLAG